MDCSEQTLTFEQTWARTQNSCEKNISKSERQSQRHSEILKYKSNSARLTKREQYAQIAKGLGPYRKTSWASQSFGAAKTSFNTRNLVKEGDTILKCP